MHKSIKFNEIAIKDDNTPNADICIVVVAFNRGKSLKRLLTSIEVGLENYKGCVDILISIDQGPSASDIAAIAKDTEWPIGKLRVRIAQNNLGLRQHVLACGDITDDYQAIIMLEDDLVVGPNFLNYAQAAIQTYDHDNSVAGISLYAPEFNEMANLPFSPTFSNYDVYALQSTQSWGQCWTKRMWRQFSNWYYNLKEPLTPCNDMPDRIYSWPETSWKKYAMKYLTATGRTWIYPYQSHSTNCSEVGTHNQQITSLFQANLTPAHNNLNMGKLDDLIHYDIYFERAPSAFIELMKGGFSPLIIDLYATKQIMHKPGFLLTTRILTQAPIKSFSMFFKPHETGVLLNENGKHARLYEIKEPYKNLLSLKYIRLSALYSNLEWKDALKFGIIGLVGAVRSRLRLR